MSEKVTEAGLKNVINGLMEGFMRDAEQEHGETVKALVEEHGDSLLNPEHYSLFVSHKHTMMERVLMNGILTKVQTDAKRRFTSDQVYALSNLYTDYAFYEAQIRKLIEDYEGHACCADKSRYLLKSYMNYIIAGDLPDFGDRSHYGIPNLATPSAWIEVLKRCGHLKYGHFDHFKEARDVLVAELEQHVAERLERLETLLTSHSYYVRKETHEKGMCYHFVQDEGDTYFYGQVIVKSKEGSGYIANNRRDGAPEGHLGYGDSLPEWFRSLLNQA